MLCINMGERRQSYSGCRGRRRAALSESLLLEVTGKIGKAFNVMQYLSEHPIKIRANQSLPADRPFAVQTLSSTHLTIYPTL